MSTKTLIPALRAKVGDWPYYICSMKYAQVAKEVYFAFELNNGNTELATLLQRGIGERTAEIVKYLKNTPGRFLGAIIVAAHGGNPLYHPVQMQDPDGLLVNLDSEFGVLEFNGSQSYFALDGQHRLKAIKDVVKQNPALGDEDICVLIVSHQDTDQGRQRTRRLFTNINKHAKVTTKAENIALDEDDSAAILTRRLLLEHSFLKEEGRVRVIGASGGEGQLKLATGNVSKADPSALFTIGGLCEIVSLIITAFRLPCYGCDKTIRPSDEVLEETYDAVCEKLDELMKACGDIESHLQAAPSAREVRAPKADEQRGHPFMRAIVQRVVMKVVQFALEQNVRTWAELQQGLSSFSWQLGDSPWNSVVSVDGNKVKMLTSRDYVNLLQKLLIAHLCPTSKVAVTSARKEYKRLKGISYPASEEDLLKGVTESVEARKVDLPEELDDMSELADPDTEGGPA
jgi:DNA sulfur modification protein DndB